MGNEFVSPDAYHFTGTTYALSLKIEIFNQQGDQIFQSFGGIENHLQVPFKDNVDHMEEKEMLLNDKEMIAEAIQIAFHPFIRYEKYPDKPKFSGEIKDHQ
jgi:hypothetical protein